MRNAYEVLGVTPNTPIDVAAEMYNERRRRIVEAPPGTQPPDETAEQIAALDWAWRVLSDPTARAEHDRALAPFASFGTQPLGPYGGTPTPPPTPPPAGPAPGWGRPAPGQWAPSPWDQSPYPPLAPRKRRTWALVLGLVLVGILIVVPVIFGVLFVMSGQGVQREDGRIVERGIISVEDLRVGDCFDDPNQIPEGETRDVMLVPAVPCDEPHDSEVFAVVELATRAGERYPGDDAIFDEAAMACAPDLERFVGVPADQTRYGMFLVHPNEASWGRGDREVICSVYDPGGKITGTLEDAGR